MDKKTAIDFLKNNQPMPNDSLLDKKTIQMYDDVRKYFLNNPDIECLPLFLNSFGEYDGYGIYQLVEDVVQMFDHDDVVNCLIESLRSPFNGVKYWCAQISALFPDEKLILPLVALLEDENDDIRVASCTSLSRIDDDRIIDVLKKQINVEKNDVVIDLLREIISDLIED